MKSLNVVFRSDEKNSFNVGQLAEVRSGLFFEYDLDFIEKGVELSPFFLPLKKGAFEYSDRDFGPLWGLFDDSLPDGWGLLLLDRYFRKKGQSFASLSTLDKLAWLGTSTMGALSYYPPTDSEEKFGKMIDLQNIYKNSKEILSGTESEVLPELLKAGGSPGGARPKVLVGYNPQDGKIISGENLLPEDYEHWMVKFNSKYDIEFSTQIEYAYFVLAEKAGIGVPDTRMFDGHKPRSFFGIKRFDRGENNSRYHIHTFGNLVHSNFRIPSADYNDLLKVTRILTKSEEDVVEMFRRMIFNIITNNRDDHVKNFSYIFDLERKKWSVAPAYDLTFSEGPGGEHSMTVNGVGKNVDIEDVLSVAKNAGIDKTKAIDVISEVKNSLVDWKQICEKVELPKESMDELKNVFSKNSRLL